MELCRTQLLSLLHCVGLGLGLPGVHGSRREILEEIQISVK